MAQRACVIGGGFGGMASAALLAHQGYEVTLLEKNEGLGGRARVWNQDGFVFDLGPSWYLMPEVFERFFARLGKKREDYYKLRKLDPYYRVFFGAGDSVDIGQDHEHNRRVFESFEVGGAEKLDGYLASARFKYDVAMKEFLYKEYRSIWQFFNRRLLVDGLKLNVFTPLDKFVQRWFKSTKARQILEYAMVFLGNSPHNAPALYSIMSHVDLNLGVWFPEGGMASLVAGMEKLILELGVTVKKNCEVTAILTKGKKALGVRTASEDILADLVVANADYAHVELELLPESARSFSRKYWESRVLAPTMFVVYLGLKKKLKKVVHHNLYFSPRWDEHFDTIFKKPSWPEEPCYYVSVASYDDAAVAPEGKENMFFLVPVAPGMDDNDQLRESYAEKIIAHFEEMTGESLSDSIEIKRIYTHRDFTADYHAWKGTSLGLSHTLFQTAVFRPPMRSKKLDNLRFVGQYTHPGVGVPMTLIAAEILADSV